MRRNHFFIYLLVQFLVIIAVTLFFKFIPDRQIAATLAGSLFVGTPVLMMAHQYRSGAKLNLLWYFGVLQFLLLFAIPILILRLLNWGIAFDQLNILGIPGPALHHWSSKSYMVMMAVTGWIFWSKRKL